MKLTTLFIIVSIAITAINTWFFMEKTRAVDCKDSVEFVTTYKNNIVVDKCVSHKKNLYKMKVHNPKSDSYQWVNVPSVVYIHMYFVGDTIR